MNASTTTPAELKALSLMIEGAPIMDQPDEVMGHLRRLVSLGLVRKSGGVGGDARYYRTVSGKKAVSA